MNTGRLESFSDGVMAVAITLLALGIAVPNPLTHHHLGHALGHQWPAYAAYVTSFVTIGIVWINHHLAISRLASADHTILILNILLLMSIVLIPFGTDLLATYLREAQGQHLAGVVYGGILLGMSLTFSALNWQILLRRHHLLRVPLGERERKAILRRSVSGTPPYAVATGLALVSPYLTLGITASLAVFYALPITNLNPPVEPTTE